MLFVLIAQKDLERRSRSIIYNLSVKPGSVGSSAPTSASRYLPGFLVLVELIAFVHSRRRYPSFFEHLCAVHVRSGALQDQRHAVDTRCVLLRRIVLHSAFILCPPRLGHHKRTLTYDHTTESVEGNTRIITRWFKQSDIPVSVGASGCVMALIGALVFTSPDLNVNGMPLLVFIPFHLLIDVATSWWGGRRIDVWGHVGGVVSGLLFSLTWTMLG